MASIDQLPPSYAPVRAKHGRYNQPSTYAVAAESARLKPPKPEPEQRPEPEAKAPNWQRVIAHWKHSIRHYAIWALFWLFATCICIGLTLTIHYRIFGNVIYECVASLSIFIPAIGIAYTGAHLYCALQKLDNAEWRYSREQKSLDD